MAANETAEGREPDRTPESLVEDPGAHTSPPSMVSLNDLRRRTPFTIPADGSEKRAYMDRIRGFLETTELPPAPTPADVYAAMVTLAEARKRAHDAMVAAEEAQAALEVARDAEAEAERNLRAMFRIMERHL